MFQIVLSLLAAALVIVEARPGYVLVPIDSLPYYQSYQMARQPVYYPVSNQIHLHFIKKY